MTAIIIGKCSICKEEADTALWVFTPDHKAYGIGKKCVEFGVKIGQLNLDQVELESE